MYDTYLYMLLQHYVESQHNWWTGSVRENETVFWWLLKHNVHKEIKSFLRLLSFPRLPQSLG